MRARGATAIIIAGVLAVGGFLLYASKTPRLVLFAHGTPEVPQGRMWVIFNPFRDRTSEHAAERLIDDLRTDQCERIVREFDVAEKYDPRVCAVMNKTKAHSLVWRQDGESSKVLVYAITRKIREVVDFLPTTRIRICDFVGERCALRPHNRIYFSWRGREYTDRAFPIFENSGSAVTSHAPRSTASSAAKASA